MVDLGADITILYTTNAVLHPTIHDYHRVNDENVDNCDNENPSFTSMSLHGEGG